MASSPPDVSHGSSWPLRVLLSVALPEPAEPRLDKVESVQRPSTPSPTSVRATFGEMLSKESRETEDALILSEPAAEPAEVRDFGPDGFDFDDSYLIQRSDGSYTEGFLQVRGSREEPTPLEYPPRSSTPPLSTTLSSRSMTRIRSSTEC